MKTKFSVDIHAHSSDNSTLLEMIGKHNEGKLKADFGLFKSYAAVNNAKYETDGCKVEVIEENEDTLQIFSGKKHILTITEKTYVGEIESEDETGKKTTTEIY